MNTQEAKRLLRTLPDTCSRFPWKGSKKTRNVSVYTQMLLAAILHNDIETWDALWKHVSVCTGYTPRSVRDAVDELASEGFLDGLGLGFAWNREDFVDWMESQVKDLRTP